MRLNTCRVCGEQEFSGSGRQLFKYGTRHYAHAKCGLDKFGASFLDRIPPHTLGDLPYLTVKGACLVAEVERRIKEAS